MWSIEKVQVRKLFLFRDGILVVFHGMEFNSFYQCAGATYGMNRDKI